MPEEKHKHSGPGPQTIPLYRQRLSYEQTMDRLRDEYADTPAGYHDDSARETARAHIEKVMEECRLLDGGKVVTQAFPRAPFAGRKQQLIEIRDSLQNGSRIFLISGMGGIGKTALMSAFAQSQEEAYDQVLFIPAGNSIRKAIVDDTILSISGMCWSERRYTSVRRYYREKISALERFSGSRRLLILLDDLQTLQVRELTTLLRVPADFLITSRLTAQAFSRLPEDLRPAGLWLSEMTGEELKDLAALLKPHLSREKLVQYEACSRRLQGHTLALKLWLLSDGVLPETDTESALTFLDRNIGNNAKQILMALSLLPPEGVPQAWLERICDAKQELSENLAERSLVQLRCGTDSQQWISLHPLIAENVRRILQPDLKKCRHFIENMAEDVGSAWNMPKEAMRSRLPAVQSILTALSERPAWMMIPLDKLFTFLWVMDDFEDAERGYAALFDNVVKAMGEPSQETGWLALRFGAVYHNSLRFEEAERWYERGLCNLRRCRPHTNDYWWQHMEACGKCMRGPLFRGDTNQVQALLMEADAVYRQAPEEARSDRLLLVEAYHMRRRASFSLKLGRLEEAQVYRRKMHEEMDQYFSRCGADGPKLLDLRETDIEFEKALGNYEKAAALLEENLRGFILYRGPDHEDTLHCLEQTADILFLQGQHHRRLTPGGDHQQDVLFLQEQHTPASEAEKSQDLLRRSRELYLQVAAGLRIHYPFEKEWLKRVEERIRTL